MAMVGKGRYLSDSNDFREGAFRFGGQITYEHLRQHYYRDDVTYFLCKGLIEESVGKGFEVIDPQTEETLDWDQELQEIISDRRMMPELVRGLAMERRDGRALLAFMRNGTELIFRSFTHEFYGVDYDEFGEVEEAVAQSDILNRPQRTEHRFGENELESIREIIFRRREKVNSGMSYMEPIWDISIALYFVASHIAYHVARAGAGIKAVEQEMDESTPVDPLDDEDIDDLIEKLANFGSANDVLVLPPGVTMNEKLLNSAGQVRWGEIFDILLARLTIYSGVPSSRLKGLVPGQLEGAEVNEESYFDVLRDIQQLVKPVLRWFVSRIAEFYDLASGDDVSFDIRFNVREEMSEVDQLELDMKQLELVEKYVSIGFTREAALRRVGVEFSGSDLEEEMPDTVDDDEVEAEGSNSADANGDAEETDVPSDGDTEDGTDENDRDFTVEND